MNGSLKGQSIELKSIEVQLKCIFKNWEKNMLARSHTRPGIGVERCPTSMFKVTLVYQQT